VGKIEDAGARQRLLAITKRGYNVALNEFLGWFQQAPRPGFTKATVSAWRVSLEDRGLGSSSAHKTSQVAEFLEQNPHTRLHFTPTYSSWLNQVEIWFARLEREVIARGIFTSVQDLSRKLMRYIRSYSKTARPFKWKYSNVRRRILPC